MARYVARYEHHVILCQLIFFSSYYCSVYENLSITVSLYELTWLFGVYLSSNFHQDTTYRIYIAPLILFFYSPMLDTSNTRLLSLCGIHTVSYIIYSRILLCIKIVRHNVMYDGKIVWLWLTGWLKHMSILSLHRTLSLSLAPFDHSWMLSNIGARIVLCAQVRATNAITGMPKCSDLNQNVSLSNIRGYCH